MKRYILPALLAGAILASAAAASAAVVIVTGVVNGPASTSVTCSPNPTANVAANATEGTALCSLSVLPTGWSGGFTVSDTTHFEVGTVSGVPTLETGPTAPPAGPFSVTVTAAP